jgi:hypothetical protein
LPRTFSVRDGQVGVVSTTTTLKLAERMLTAARVISMGLPPGFSPPTPMNLLLELFIAEESAHYPKAAELGKHDGMSQHVVDRWLIALSSERLIERNEKAVALTEHGRNVVVRVLEAIINAQNLLN